jgi:hypothetical protein
VADAIILSAPAEVGIIVLRYNIFKEKFGEAEEWNPRRMTKGSKDVLDAVEGWTGIDEVPTPSPPIKIESCRDGSSIIFREQSWGKMFSSTTNPKRAVSTTGIPITP